MAKKLSTLLPFLTLGLILLASALFMGKAANGDSAIMDELAHIPAGYDYVRYLDYRLNPEHPPLVKALAATPLLFSDAFSFPTDQKSWTSDVNGQWDAGHEFLYESGNNADKIISLARIFPMILTLLMIILVFLWSRELLGTWWALLPAFLFGLSPAVLAHGHYVTTDIGAALGIFLGLYGFVSFLLKPSGKMIILAGLALGVAELMKFSSVLLIPFLFLLLVIFYAAETIRNFRSGNAPQNISFYTKRAWYYFRSYLLILLVAIALIYGTYLLFTINYPPERQISDTTTILASASPQFLVNIDLFLVKSPVLRPLGEYLLGVIMVLQRSAGGNTGYFLGAVTNTGWWYYFPVVFLLKEPLPSLILILLATLFALTGIVKNARESVSVKKTFSDYLGTRFPEFAMLLFIVLYVGYSMSSTLNIGFRHLFPILPLAYILAASGLKTWVREKKERKTALHSVPTFSRTPYPKKASTSYKIKTAFITILIIWYAGEAFGVSPYFLSYFNQIGGGTQYGFRYVTDSNYDWGQDLKRLAVWTKENHIQKIAINYFGGGDPHYYLGDTAENWHSSLGDPREKNIEWLAVSVNILSQAFGQKVPWLDTKPENNYEWLSKLKPTNEAYGQIPIPDARAGTSIFIYHL